MATAKGEESDPNSWEEFLRKMLPEGAPLPDEEHLDYSISVDYTGPSQFFKPRVGPTIPKTKFTTYPKQSLSFTPINTAAWKSNSSSESTDRRGKESSASSVDFDESGDRIMESVYELCDDRDDSSSFDDGKITPEVKEGSRVSSVGIKRGGCERCKKRKNGLFKEAEGCIVCGAEYCMKCVLKAMGTMPEGRKCVKCIGNPIDEVKRGKLGKCSRALARVCGRSDIEQIMKLERECKANQVRPNQVSVNGRQLKDKELMELLNCAIPPMDLKPGSYWYDKNSGLWGKNGEKPTKIISSNLDVGSKLRVDASNGNTRVYMNGREITGLELKILKLAKVQCPRGTHFWLYEDGSYEEEGQNNIKGFIWEKASIRFLCSMLSLPVPPEGPHCTKEQPVLFSENLVPEYSEQHSIQKLLLIGSEGSGISTIFKQVKFLYADKFNTEELLEIKLIIQSNMDRYLLTLLEAREHFEEEALNNLSHVPVPNTSVSGEMENDLSRECIYSFNQNVKKISDSLLDQMTTTGDRNVPASAAPEYAHLIAEIWKDPAIQETYKRREELQFLPDVAKYFLDRVIEISSDKYCLSEKDILFAEGVTPSNGVACTEFSLHDHSTMSHIYDDTHQPEPKYQLIQLSSKELLFNHKWSGMFQGMRAVVFCLSLADYDQVLIKKNGTQQNKVLASRDLLESAARQGCFEGVPFVLLLNKDRFEDKLREVPLTVCEWFADFSPLKSHGRNISLAYHAFYYVASKFKESHALITGRKLYVWPVQVLERASVDEAFRYVGEIVKWEERNGEFSAISGDSVSSAEMSSSSPSFQY